MPVKNQSRIFSPAAALCLFIVCLIPLASGCSRKNAGAELFKKKCSSCHGIDGRGKTRLAEGRPFADLTDGKWKHNGDRESIFKLVADGDPKSPMPPFRERLSPEELNLVVDHAVQLGSGGAAPQK
jgi:mono/diheme cytochrome c family protein